MVAFPALQRQVPDCGGWEIRTPEGLPPTRFPSERHRPLGESSNGARQDTGPRAPGRRAPGAVADRVATALPGGARWTGTPGPRRADDRRAAPMSDTERLRPDVVEAIVAVLKG